MKRLYLIILLMTCTFLGFSRESTRSMVRKEAWRVRLIHGSKDTIVPLSCSERFVESYTQDAELIVVEGENHMITKKLKTVVSHAVSFFASQLI